MPPGATGRRRGQASPKSKKVVENDSYENFFEYDPRIGKHKPGSIIRIELRNFMTHSHVVMECGPRLNIVIGANGTGKSALLNAICLGLGGEPKLLGRADDVRDFVAHGSDVAEIKLTLAPLSDDADTHVLSRHIDRNKGSERGQGRGSSTFFINDVQASAQQIRQLVQETYHISIDNLCTFLPQDKVGSFSGLDSTKLLEETEKTLSENQQLYKMHQDMIKLEQELQGGTNNVHSLQARLENLQAENARLERELERLEEREQALRQINLYSKKRVWLQFDILREEALELKEQRENLKKQLKAESANIKPLEDAYKAYQDQTQQIQGEIRAADGNKQSFQREMDKQTKKYETHDDNIDSDLTSLSVLDAKRSQLQAKKAEAQQHLDDLLQTEKSLPSRESAENEFKEQSQRRKDLGREYENIKRQLKNLYDQKVRYEDEVRNLKHKLLRLEDQKSQSKQRVFAANENLKKIYAWLDQNRQTFRRTVWGPVAAEITVFSNDNAAFIEQHVPNTSLFSFIVETKQDSDYLYEQVRRVMKIPINITLIEQGRLAEVNRLYPPDRMEMFKREHGIQGYLDECFDAPDAVMAALRSVAAVDKVLVGNKQTQESIDKAGLLDILSENPQDPNNKMASVVCTVDADRKRNKYSQLVSRYTKKIGSRPDYDIREARILGSGVNPAEILDLKEQIDAIQEKLQDLEPNLNTLTEKKSQIEIQMQEVRSKVEAAQQTINALDAFSSKLRRAEAKLNDYNKELSSDDSGEKRRLVELIMNRVRNSITALETHANQHSNMSQIVFDSSALSIRLQVCTIAMRQAKEEWTEKKQDYTQLETQLQQVSHKFQLIKQKLNEKNEEAKRIAPLLDDRGRDLPLKKQLEELEFDTLEDVEAALEEAQTKADSIDANPTVLRQYEERKREITELEERINEITYSEGAKADSLVKMRSQWESVLEPTVSDVNELFSKYMAEMKCEGEVRLKKAEMVDGESASTTGNYKDWGIEILVSFRENSKKQVLSAQVQSGGERSVSTIMYLMALQEMIVAPFRCVDEINQGLDERNERLVFKRIVANSTRAPPSDEPTNHSGQYFLITPKLLPKLTGMETLGVTVHIVYNGIGNFDHPTDFNMNALIAAAERASNSRQHQKRPSNNDNNSDDGSSGRRSQNNKRGRR